MALSPSLYLHWFSFLHLYIQCYYTVWWSREPYAYFPRSIITRRIRMARETKIVSITVVMNFLSIVAQSSACASSFISELCKHASCHCCLLWYFNCIVYQHIIGTHGEGFDGFTCYVYTSSHFFVVVQNVHCLPTNYFCQNIRFHHCKWATLKSIWLHLSPRKFRITFIQFFFCCNVWTENCCVFF